MRIAVLGGDCGRLCDDAHRLLPLDGVELCRSTDGADAVLLLDRRWDAPLAAKVAIVCGDAESMADAAVAISYGLSPRDTLTVSSTEPHGVALSVQREFDTLDGRRVLIQELTPGWQLPPERALPLAALGLVTGKLDGAAYAASSE